MRRLSGLVARRRLSSGSEDVVDSVRVGEATVPLRRGGAFVPTGYLESLPRRLLPTLEFLAQKDFLAQASNSRQVWVGQRVSAASTIFVAWALAASSFSTTMHRSTTTGQP